MIFLLTDNMKQSIEKNNYIMFELRKMQSEIANHTTECKKQRFSFFLYSFNCSNRVCVYLLFL